jgi:hypothetical protein
MAWGFIVARALIVPACAMYLAMLGKRAMVRREMYGQEYDLEDIRREDAH